MEEKQKFNHKNINLGIEILRTILASSIVIRHFLKPEYNNNFLTNLIFHCQPFYVPTFFIISFYFSYNTFISKNIIKIKERFIRILIPYTIWPIFFWIRNNIYNYRDIILNINLFRGIFFQLLIGYDFYAVFWFQFDLIIISIIVTIIIFILGNHYTFTILKLLVPLFFILNNKYENLLNIYKRIGSIKPLLSSYIYSITGFLFGSISILKKMSNKRKKVFLLIIPAIIFINQYKNIIQISRRFKIVVVDIVVSILFFVFALIPLEYITNKFIKKIIMNITSYTGGIYYIHYGVRSIFSPYFKIIENCNLISCIVNYLLCYFICLIGFNIFKKSKLRYLFI